MKWNRHPVFEHPPIAIAQAELLDRLGKNVTVPKIWMTAPAGVPLEYRIDSFNANGSSAWDYGYNYDDVTLPGAPTNLVATPDDPNGQVDLSWNYPYSDLITGGFEIQWSDDGNSFYTIDTVLTSTQQYTPQTTWTYTDTSPTVNGSSTNYYRIVAYVGAYPLWKQ